MEKQFSDQNTLETNITQGSVMLSPEGCSEPDLNASYKKLLLRNKQLDAILKKNDLYFDCPKLKKAATILKELGLTSVNKLDILKAYSNQLVNKAENNARSAALQLEANRLDKKIKEIEECGSQLEKPIDAFKLGLKKQLNDVTAEATPKLVKSNKLPEIDIDQASLIQEELFDLALKFKKKQEECIKLEKEKEKYLGLPPDLASAKKMIKEAKLLLSQKQAEFDQECQKFYN